MNKKRSYSFYVLLFSVTYFVSYITRINYGAIITEIESATSLSKSALSMAVTGSFITYGAGQIVSGFFGDRVSPKKLVGAGLAVTALMNLLVPLTTSPYQMTALWCVNGFAQAFMWPPIVKLMTMAFNDDEYKSASVKVSWGSSFGTMAVYLVAPLLISLFSWKAVFVFSAVFAVIMLLVWFKLCDISEKSRDIPAVKKEKGSSLKILFSPLMLSVMVAIILQGMLRDGVTTWMPSYIAETYNLNSAVAILTGIALPIFSILNFNVTSFLYQKRFKNPILCAALLFACGAFSALALVLASGKVAFVSALLSALLTGSMHGVNLILICMLPPYFKNTNNVSTVSGILNSCTYIGSAISTYAIAVITEKHSWDITLLIWILIALAGTMICLFCIKPWQKKINEQQEMKI